MCWQFGAARPVSCFLWKGGAFFESRGSSLRYVGFNFQCNVPLLLMVVSSNMPDTVFCFVVSILDMILLALCA